jgi:hypothetical protein
MNWTEIKTLQPTTKDADANGNILILEGDTYKLISVEQVATIPQDCLWLRNHRNNLATKLRQEYYSLIGLDEEDVDIYEHNHPTECVKCEQQNVYTALQWLNESWNIP